LISVQEKIKKNIKHILKEIERKIIKHKSTTKDDSHKITKKKKLCSRYTSHRRIFVLHHFTTAGHILQMATIVQDLKMTIFIYQQ